MQTPQIPLRLKISQFYKYLLYAGIAIARYHYATTGDTSLKDIFSDISELSYTVFKYVVMVQGLARAK